MKKVKSSLCLTKHYAMKTCVFLTSALVGREWSASRPGRFTPGERAPGTHWIGGLVGPRASLDDVEKRNYLTLPGLELRALGHPARSQSLYRLRYPGSSSSVNWKSVTHVHIGSKDFVNNMKTIFLRNGDI
jgi:hypothetical protein